MSSPPFPSASSRWTPPSRAAARRCTFLIRDWFGQGLIAATALVHGMTIVTRDVADFAPTGVRVLDPWLEQPS
jgi:predicted nucleic acid-binding protein